MNLDLLQEFLFWCLMINMGLYSLNSIAILLFREFLYKIIQSVFRLDNETVVKSFYTYLANYKLLILFFNFVPWIAIMLVNDV